MPQILGLIMAAKMNAKHFERRSFRTVEMDEKMMEIRSLRSFRPVEGVDDIDAGYLAGLGAGVFIWPVTKLHWTGGKIPGMQTFDSGLKNIAMRDPGLFFPS